jgi:ketosteroid isomerase-like protein
MSTRNRLLAVAGLGLAITLLTAACQAPQPASLTSSDETALRGVFEKAVTSARANDWATFVTVFAEDAQYHPPGNPPVVGPEAIRKWAESGPRLEAIEFENVQFAGAGAYAYGTSTIKMTAQGSPEDTGKQLVVLRRDGVGKWLVVAVSWNSNQPPPAQTAAAAPGN